MSFKKLKLSPFDELIVSGSHYTVIPINGVLEHMGTEIVHNLTLNGSEFFYSLRGCTVETDADVAYVTQGNMAKVWELVELIVEQQEVAGGGENHCPKPDQNTLSQDRECNSVHSEIEQVKTDHGVEQNLFCYKIVGNGRSTLCKTLCNILARLNRKVLLIEMDPAQGHICFPGTIGLRKMNTPSIIDDYSNSLLYFYGNDKIENMEYFQYLREKILENRRKLRDNSSEKMIEILLDVQSGTFDDIKTTFHIVVGDETLFHQISSENKFFIPCHRYQKKDKHFKISEYFYGHPERENQDKSQTEQSKKNQNITFSVLSQYFTPIIMKKALKVHQIGEQFLPPMSALPIGHDRKTNNLMIRAIRPEQNGIIAISYGKNERELLDNPIKGFLLYMGDDQWLTVQDKINEGMFLSGNIRVSECFD